MAAAAAAGLASASTTSDRAPSLAQPAPEEAARLLLRERRTPDVPLLDHNGKRVRFYSDVMKNRRVVLNVMYSVCSNVCTPATRNLIEARELLGGQATELRFVSMTLTPLTDTPQALRAYRQQYGISDDWTFLTGTPENMERIQRGLGFISDAEGDDLLSHSAMARFCDERHQRWTHINTLAPPRTIARAIRFELA
jgi:protein SCO1/2